MSRTKYLEKSASVLSEADRMQAIMDWQLFCYEQETRQFEERFVVTWRPGDYLYPHPDKIDDELNGGSQYARRMFDLHDDGSPYELMACKTCEVSWNLSVTRECWLCGKYVKSYGIDVPRAMNRPSRLPEPRSFVEYAQADVRATNRLWRGATPRTTRVVHVLQAYRPYVSEMRFRQIQDIPDSVWDNVWAETAYDWHTGIQQFRLEVHHRGKTFQSRLRIPKEDLLDMRWGEKEVFAEMIHNVSQMISEYEARRPE